MMVEVFGLEAPAGRRAAMRFNLIPRSQRQTFFALTFGGIGLDEAAAAGLGTREHVQQNLRTSLAALSQLGPPTLADLLALEGIL